MASGVEELLDMLFDMVDEAKNVPLSSDKCMIERDRALDLIDDIRAQFPVELSEAKKLMASRADMIASAKREADAIRRQAEEKAKQMLAEESILLQARQRANELMQQAEDRSRELKRSANDYCEDALRRTEELIHVDDLFFHIVVLPLLHGCRLTEKVVVHSLIGGIPCVF